MYAVIKTGGKQYKVEVGSEIEVEKLDGEVGTSVELPVVAVFDGTTIKTAKANVSAKIIEHGKGEKLDIFKYKPKKNIRKRMGHRQPFTKVKITKI